MGIHANSTCVLNYDSAKGWLVGQMHKGMQAMFVMMNAARLGVGVQGLSQAEVAYQNALTYANARLQGRSITVTKAPDKRSEERRVGKVCVRPGRYRGARRHS